jgi:hypothetical protein
MGGWTRLVCGYQLFLGRDMETETETETQNVLHFRPSSRLPMCICPQVINNYIIIIMFTFLRALSNEVLFF